MPRIGNVEVSDDVINSLRQAAVARIPVAPRPGLGEVFGAAARGAIGQLRYGLPYQAGRITGELTPEDEAYYQRGLAETAAAASRAAPAGVEDVTSGRVGIGRFVGENLVASLPYMAGMAAGALAGGVAGSAVPGLGTAAGAIAGGIAGGTPQFSASNVARAVEEEGSLSQVSAERSLLVAPLQASADAAIGRFLPGAGKVLGDLASTQTGGFLRRTAASMVKAGGTEAVTEAAQQLGERYAAGLPVGNADAAGEYVNAAVTAFAVGGVLGAGGGFRRTNALAKSADQVTNDDMVEHTQGILDGTGQTQPLALPSPEAFGRSSTGTVLVDSAGRAAMAPADPALVEPAAASLANMPRMSDPALQLSEADTPGALADRFIAAQAAQQAELDAAAPNVLAQPALPEFQPDQPLAVPPVDTSVAALAAQAPQVAPAPVSVPPAVRPLQGADIADLRKARRHQDVDAAMATAIDEEMAYRKQENPFLDVRMNQDIARLQDLPREQQVAGVRTLLEEGDARTGTFDLARNLGIDPDAMGAPATVQAQPTLTQEVGRTEPAPLAPITQEVAGAGAPQVEPTASPLVPSNVVQTQADPAFAEEWQQLRQAAGIQRMRSGRELLPGTPANLEQARAQVFRALADDAVAREGQAASQVERMAQQMGLITNDEAMDVTPLGRQAYLSTPEGLEETVTAARQQGFEGARASQFDRGVRAQISGEAAPAFTDFDDMAAFQAGQVWAQDFIQNGDTRTAAQTQAIQSRQAARTTGTPVERGAARPELSPAQVQQQALNRLLDSADMTNVSDSDVAALRRMVAQGASSTEVGQALQQVQGGQTLFREAPRQAAAFTPANVSRGQPVFREMYDPTEATPQKAEQRAQTEPAVQAYEMRGLIEFAKAEGGITEARAAKLHEMLDQGKVAQVKGALKAFDPDAPQQTQQRLPTPPETVFERGADGRYTGGADAAFEAAIDGKDLDGVLDHMISAAPSKYHRELMRKVKSAADALRKRGVDIGIQVVRPGDVAPVVLNRPDVRAFTVSRMNPPSAQVYLKASEMGEQSGTNYQLAAHELLHAVTDRLVNWGSKEANRNTKIGKDVRELLDLGNAIISHFNQRAADGNLNEFERAYFERTTNAMANAHEILAWGLTNPDMQRYLQSIEYKPRQSVFGRFVELLRNLLGLDGKYDTALTELLRVSERIMKPNQNDIISAHALNNADGFDTGEIVSPAQDTGSVGTTASAMNGVTEELAQVADRVMNQINPRDLAVKFRRTALGWQSITQLARTYAQQIPAILDYRKAHSERTAIRSRFEQMGAEAYQSFEVLERANANQAKWVGEMMGATTEFRLDPDKTWDEHTWLHDDPNATNLKRLHGELVDKANKLKRGNGAGWQQFQDFRALNEAQNFARMAVGLHGLVATDPELQLGVDRSWVNPADQFMRAEGISTPTQIRDYWAKALDDQVATATAFVREKKGELAGATANEQRATRQHLSPVEMQLNAILESKAAMAQAPYFHLGRFGDNFGSAEIAKGADGRVDPVAQRKVAEALEAAGFGDAQISSDSTKPRFMLRFDTVDQTEQFRDLMLKLQKQGLLSDGEIKAGPRNLESNFGTADGMPEFVRAYIQNLEASPMFAADPGMSDVDRAALEKRKQDAIQLARDTWIESQPDSAISKVLTKRYEVPGYSKDMVRNFAHRWRIGSINIANTASAPKFDQTYTSLKAQYNDALVANRRDDDGNLIAPEDPFVAQDVTNELKRRDARVPLEDTADTFDKLRGFAHSYFLGLSPAYGMINMTQLGVTALPEMAKKHGYVKSFHAMRRASTQALAIVKAAGAEARKLGWKNWGDVAITDKVLKNAGLDPKMQDFLQHMLATGTIDIGSMARSLGQVADNRGIGGATETYLKLSSSIGLYTETFSRLVAALAARDLHGGYGPDAQAYAAKTVSEAMFDYQNWNTARQLGKKGFLGPVTPLLTQFMSYQVQITEKLYSEAMDAFSKARPGESAAAAKQRQREARRFLGGHLAAVTALAGTLGMPFATVFATVLERIVDAFDDDDDPFDATAAYRNFLSEVFGKEVGEVIARGAPRALGFDISARAGEQNLLPFSEFFADRRSWKDAVADNAGRSLGAVPSMFINVLDGGSQIASGDVLGGMKAMLPVAYKGPTEVYRMTTDGYVDTRGNRLPMTPTASSYMWQLLGFSPAAKAEYGEARADQAARRGEITRKAGQLRNNIVRAVVEGDRDTARDLIADAIKFDTDNPGFAVLPSIASSIQRQQQSQLQSQVLGAPIGVSMRDIAGQQLTSYANF